MAKRSLRPDLAKLEGELIETLLAGHNEWRPDLAYPQSHSDMQGAVRGLLRMYAVTRRPVAVDLEYEEEAGRMLVQHFRARWREEVAAGKTTVSFDEWVAHGNHFKPEAA